MIIRNGTLTTTSPLIKVLKRTDDITSLLWIYGTGIPVDTQIKSIDSSSQITMTRNATATGIKSLEITNASVGVWQERNDVLIDIKNICDERGEIIEFMQRNEGDITRDTYGSIDKKFDQTKYFLRIYPIQFAPNDKQLEKAGIKDRVDVVIYTAMKDWITNGIDFKDIDIIRSSVKLQGNVYEIKSKGLASQFSDTFCYITFGLNLK